MAVHCKPRTLDVYTFLCRRHLFPVRGPCDTCRRWHPDWLELIATATWSGPRQGEILGLQWEDIDFAGRLIEVRRTISYGKGALRTGSPKSGRARRVDVLAANESPLYVKDQL